LIGGIEFLFVAMGISIIIGSLRGGRGRRRGELEVPRQQPMLEDPRVSQLQAEVDELRSQVERLSAAESFYAQLNAPAPPASAQPPPPTPPRLGG
jgi:hypothetical protein